MEISITDGAIEKVGKVQIKFNHNFDMYISTEMCKNKYFIAFLAYFDIFLSFSAQIIFVCIFSEKDSMKDNCLSLLFLEDRRKK